MSQPISPELQLQRISELQRQIHVLLLADDPAPVSPLLEECGMRWTSVTTALDKTSDRAALLMHIQPVLQAHLELAQLIERQLPLLATQLRKAGDLKRVARQYAKVPAKVRQEAARTRDLLG